MSYITKQLRSLEVTVTKRVNNFFYLVFQILFRNSKQMSSDKQSKEEDYQQ